MCREGDKRLQGPPMPVCNSHIQFDFPEEKNFYQFHVSLIVQTILGYRNIPHIKNTEDQSIGNIFFLTGKMQLL